MVELYYKEEAGSFYSGDCIEGMKQITEDSCQLLFTSPPYNIKKKYEENQSLGEYLKLLADFMEQGFRVVKPGGYAIINYADYYMFDGINTRILPMSYLFHMIGERCGWQNMCIRYWSKNYPSLTDPYTISSTLPKLEIELMSVFRKPGGGKEKVREQNLHGHAIFNTSGEYQSTSTLKHHPAAFPESLVTMILTVYTDPGDKVLDCFFGSGTTGVVAKRMGRKYVGFELMPEYCELAKVRLSQQEFGLTVPFANRQIGVFEVIKDKSAMPDDF